MATLAHLLTYRAALKPRSWPLTHSLVMTVSFVGLAGAAVYFALGYQVNWQTRSIQRTGMIVIDTKLQRLDGVTLTLNGQAQALSGTSQRFPLLMPGDYDVLLTKPGYQKWERRISLQENRVVSFSNTILISDPVAQPARAGTVVVLPPLEDAGLAIDGGDLRLKGELVTRLQRDILQAGFYADGAGIAVQAGNLLLLIDPVTKVSQELLVLPEAYQKAIPFGFADNGRIVRAILPDGTALERTLFE